MFIIASPAAYSHELQQMLQELADESENHGLKMNKSKTMVMMENDVSVCHIPSSPSQHLRYIYLGQRYSTRDKKSRQGDSKKNHSGWTAFAKSCNIFKSNTGTCLKRHAYFQ